MEPYLCDALDVKPWELDGLTEQQVSEALAYREGKGLGEWAAQQIATEEARGRSNA